MKKIRILSYETQSVYNTSITVYTQKQISCVTWNYEALTSLILYTLWCSLRTLCVQQSMSFCVGHYRSAGHPHTLTLIHNYFSYKFSGVVLNLLGTKIQRNHIQVFNFDLYVKHLYLKIEFWRNTSVTLFFFCFC